MAYKAFKQTRLVHNNKKHISHLLHSSGLLTSNRRACWKEPHCPISISLSGVVLSQKKHLSHTLYCLIACWLLLQSHKLMAWFNADIGLCSSSVIDVPNYNSCILLRFSIWNSNQVCLMSQMKQDNWCQMSHIYSLK